jgi:hypothetical protein
MSRGVVAMRAWAVLAAGTMLVVAGCDQGGEPPASDDAAVGLAWQECAGEVAIQFTARHRCGVLTVPLDHGDTGGSSLGLEVVQVWPPSDPGSTTDSDPSTDSDTDPDIALSVGFNAGEPAQEPGLMALLAERLGVPVVSLAPRGVGVGGGRDLDCPELEGLGAAQATQPDAAGRAAFLAAVKACSARLVREGVDATNFGVDDVVADLEALRTAIDVERWHVLVTYGEMARVSDGYSSAYGDRVRAVVKDSPPPPDRDPVSAGADGTRSALAALFEECSADIRCSSRYPELDRAWQQALDGTAARPMLGSGSGGEVLVDAPKLLRAVRAMLGGDGPAHVPDLPRVIAAAADGEVHPTLARVVASDPDHCNGHRPICTKPNVSLGAYLSQVCPEVPVDRAVREREPVYDEVFGDNVYADACSAWGAASAVSSAPGQAPTLVLVGHLDAWSRPEWFDGAVSVRGATHDVAGGFPCVLGMRSAWVANPTEAADPDSCDAVPFPDWD